MFACPKCGHRIHETAAMQVARVGREHNLTPTQAEVLRLILRYQDKFGMSPTLQELADGRGVSKISTFELVNALQKKGVICRAKHDARSIRVIA